MFVKALLTSLVFLIVFNPYGFSQTRNNKINSLFIEEKALTEYTTFKEMIALRERINRKKGDRVKNLYQLAGLLNTYGAVRSPQESKFYIDSASSCIKMAGKSDKKKFLQTAFVVETRYAEYYKGQGDYSKSLYHYQNALGTANPKKSSLNLHFELAGLFMLLNNHGQFGLTLGLIKSLSGKYTQQTWNIGLLEKMLLYSRQDSLEAIKIAEGNIVGIHNKASLIRNESKLTELKAKGRRESAQKMFIQANQSVAESISRWYLATHQYDSALTYLRILLNYSDSTDTNYAYTYFNIAKIFETRNQFDSASMYYDKYVNTEGVKLEYHYEAARYYAFVVGQTSKAITTFRQSIDFSRAFIKNVESLPFSEKKIFIESQKLYLDYFTSFVTSNIHNHPELSEDLYNLLLTTKAVQLNSSLRMTGFVTTSQDTTVQAQYEMLKLKRNELTRAQNSSIEETNRLKSQITEIERSLYAKSETFNSMDNGNISWKGVLNKLASDESAIEVLRYSNVMKKQGEYIALIVHGDKRKLPEVALLGNADNLENRAYKYYSNAIISNITDTLSYKSFWATLATQTTGSKKIYISVDGVYYKINLNTLFNPRTKKYILEESNLETILSTRELVIHERGSGESEQRPVSAVLFGSPNFEGTVDAPEPIEIDRNRVQLPGQTRSMSFSYLSGAKKEVSTLDGFLKSSGVQVKTYLDNAASEENIKRISKPDVLHIATHGFFFEPGNTESNPFQQKFNNPDPMFNTGLLFAGVANPQYDSEEDGVLTAFEAATVDLATTKLVVLSACETGAGEVQNGEGVFGLQRSFKMAGAQHLLMSLWKVDDEVTQKLMTQFYSFWIAGMDIRTAFYMAQLNVKKEKPSPYYWGAFILL